MENPRSVPDLVSALKEVLIFLHTRKLDYCLIGGLAMQVRGEPRFTKDIDICLLSSLDTTRAQIEELLSVFQPLYPDAFALALTFQILPLTIHGVTVDVSLGLTGFENQAISRATMEEIVPAVKAKVCSSEDLIVFKILAGRARDQSDVESILSSSKNEIDDDYVVATLKGFEVELDNSMLVSAFETIKRNCRAR